MHSTLVLSITCWYSFVQVVFNKYLLSSSVFPHPILLAFVQCAFTALFVLMKRLIQGERFPWIDRNIFIMFLPSFVAFVGMIVSSTYSLKHLRIPTANILKSLTNVLIISLEYILYGRRYRHSTILCVILIILSAFAAGWTDISLSGTGLLLQLVNNCFTGMNWIALKYVNEDLGTNRKLRYYTYSFIVDGLFRRSRDMLSN